MTLAEGLFAAALGVAWFNAALHVALSDRPLYVLSARAMGGRVRAVRLAVVLGSGAVFGGAVWAWATDWPRLGGASAVAILWAMRRWELREWGEETSLRLGKYALAAACLSAWTIAYALATAVAWGPSRADAAGWNAAAGVVAGAYVLAAASKVRRTGWGWVDWPAQALLVAERAYTGPRWVRAIRRFVADSPRLCAFAGRYALGIEWACALYVFPAARVPLTGAILGLHAGIALLLGYFEPEWWLVMIAVTLAGA